MVLITGFMAGGALWGIAARVWMRMISSEPEFSWSGTLFIVGLFCVVGTAQGVAFVVRRHRWRRWQQTPVRAGAGFAALLLGAGAGSIMLPSLIAGALAMARSDWHPRLRGALAAIVGLNVASMVALLHSDLTWMRTIVGWLAMSVLYAVIIAAISLNLRPLDDGWHLGRQWLAVIVAGAAAVMAALLLPSIGL